MTTSRPSRTWPFDLFKALVALLLLAAMLYLRPDLSTALQQQLGLPVGSVTVLEAPATTAGSAAVTLSGRTQAGATVELFAGENQLGATTAGADGTWSLPVTLPTGSYDLRAQARDAAGSALGAPAVLAWSGAAQPAGQPDTQSAESTPAIASGGETAGDETAGAETAAADESSPAASNTGDGSAGEESGSGETAAGTASGETTAATGATADATGAPADAAGASSGVPGASSGVPGASPDAADASPETAGATANAADAARTDAAAGAAFAVLPEPAAVSSQGVTLRGTGAPGAIVDIVGAEGILGSATVDPDGAWSVELALSPGPYELLARMTYGSGEQQSAPVVSVTVPDTTAPNAAASNATSASVQAELGAAQVLDGAANLSGSGAPGSTVEVIATSAGGADASTAAVEEIVLGSTTVGPDGMWSLSGFVPPGEYQLSLRTLDEDGTVVDTTPAVPFRIPADTGEDDTGRSTVTTTAETAADRTATAGTVTTGTVSAGIVTTGTTTTGTVTTGTMTTGTMTTGTVTTGTVTTGTMTTGTVTTGTMTTGTVTAGTVTAGTATTTARPAVTARTTPTATVPSPTPAARTAAAQTAVSLAAPSFSQPTYAANTLTLRGTGEPGSTIQIVSGASVLGADAVGPDGQWSLTAEVVPGNYQLQLIRQDTAGAITGKSPVVALKIPAAETTPAVAEPEADASSAVTLTATAATTETAEETTVVTGAEGQAYTVQSGDTLTGLAQQYLGNQARYREIVAATNERAQQDTAIDPITNPDVISSGQTIWIPAR